MPNLFSAWCMPIIAGSMLLFAFGFHAESLAAVIVFNNETDELVYFAVAVPGESPQAYRIAAGDVLPVPVLRGATIRFNAGKQVVDQPASPNSIQTFQIQDRLRLELTERRFVETAGDSKQHETVTPPADGSLDRIGTIPVMILVDEDEPAARRVWEERLRERLKAASDIFEHHARIRFEIVAVGTWESDDSINDFTLSLREFERRARLESPAQIAIGFTSQYKKPDQKRVHMGGTRGPLFPYLLVREWPQHISETERLEVLVHELGHVLGAVHSPDTKSVMRPLVGDRQSRARDFRIQFDPLNTLAMYLFCEQLRLGQARGLSEFSPQSRNLLARLYAEMDREFPGDTSAQRYRAIMQHASSAVATGGSTSLASAARSVVRTVARAAAENDRRPPRAESPPDAVFRLEGDALTDYYVRAAAAEARRHPDAIAAKACLFGLAVALADANLTEQWPALDAAYRRYETNQERRARLNVLGKPTMHQRHDLVQHFIVSASLCLTVGASGAESIGVAKEVVDSRRGGKLSFVDLAANIAGISFASRLAQGTISLERISETFEVRQFVLDPALISADLSPDEFETDYGHPGDARFRAKIGALREKVLALPGFSEETVNRQ